MALDNTVKYGGAGAAMGNPYTAAAGAAFGFAMDIIGSNKS